MPAVRNEQIFKNLIQLKLNLMNFHQGYIIIQAIAVVDKITDLLLYTSIVYESSENY